MGIFLCYYNSRRTVLRKQLTATCSLVAVMTTAVTGSSAFAEKADKPEKNESAGNSSPQNPFSTHPAFVSDAELEAQQEMKERIEFYKNSFIDGTANPFNELEAAKTALKAVLQELTTDLVPDEPETVQKQSGKSTITVADEDESSTASKKAATRLKAAQKQLEIIRAALKATQRALEKQGKNLKQPGDKGSIITDEDRADAITRLLKRERKLKIPSKKERDFEIPRKPVFATLDKKKGAAAFQLAAIKAKDESWTLEDVMFPFGKLFDGAGERAKKFFRGDEDWAPSLDPFDWLDEELTVPRNDPKASQSDEEIKTVPKVTPDRGRSSSVAPRNTTLEKTSPTATTDNASSFETKEYVATRTQDGPGSTSSTSPARTTGPGVPDRQAKGLSNEQKQAEAPTDEQKKQNLTQGESKNSDTEGRTAEQSGQGTDEQIGQASSEQSPSSGTTRNGGVNGSGRGSSPGGTGTSSTDSGPKQSDGSDEEGWGGSSLDVPGGATGYSDGTPDEGSCTSNCGPGNSMPDPTGDGGGCGAGGDGCRDLNGLRSQTVRDTTLNIVELVNGFVSILSNRQTLDVIDLISSWADPDASSSPVSDSHGTAGFLAALESLIGEARTTPDQNSRASRGLIELVDLVSDWGDGNGPHDGGGPSGPPEDKAGLVANKDNPDGGGDGTPPTPRDNSNRTDTNLRTAAARTTTGGWSKTVRADRSPTTVGRQRLTTQTPTALAPQSQKLAPGQRQSPVGTAAPITTNQSHIAKPTSPSDNAGQFQSPTSKAGYSE